EKEILVSYIGRSLGVLREFFSKCRAKYLKLVKGKTSVFKVIDIRLLDIVILNEKKKTALLEDIKAFLDPK
ncbi:hypothetical protein BJ875DRAFT_352127, partial [Amylocarpus encephaloides]